MSNRVKIGIVLAYALAGAAIGWAGGIGEADRLYEEELGSAQQFDVNNGSVDVYVRQTDGPPRLEAQLHEDRELTVSQSGDSVRIVVRGAVTFSFGSLDERIDIFVNDGARLRFDTGSGDLRLDGLDLTELRISAGSADVDLTEVSGAIDIETGSGDQTLRDVSGSVSLVAGSGDLELDDVAGLYSIGTSSGNVSGGSIIVERGLEVSTGSGDVDLAFENPEDDFTFNLRARSGYIRLNKIRTEDRLTLGDGPITIDVNTGSGDQHIRAR